jgi:histone acetyltransferase (RNA polymerase elongator complex component)
MKKIIPIFIPQQGCMQRCIFCHQPHITGVARHTAVTPADVRQAIDTAFAEPKSRKKGAQFEVAFYGGTFTGLALDIQEQLLRTVQPYLQRGEIVGIRLSTHPKMFDAQILALLAAYRVTTVELGVQSFDPLVLQNAARGHTGEDAEEIIRKLQGMGMAVVVHLMLGLPGASAESDLQSAAKTIALRPAGVRLHPTLVLRQTRLADLYRQ